MDYKEAVQQINDYAFIGTRDLVFKCMEARDVINAHVEKYRWHDCNKNPKDVPSNEDQMLCEYYFDDGSGMVYVCDYFAHGKWRNDHNYLKGEIMRWREIE